MLRLRDRFLFHIIVKHVTELTDNGSAKPRENSCVNKSALVQSSVAITGSGVLRSAEMGITSAGMQSRNADCGGHGRTRTMRQIQQNTTVHYLVSPPWTPRKTTPSQSHVLTRLEVATRRKRRVLLYEPRVAFYTQNAEKKQNINAHNVSIDRNVSHPILYHNETAFKKSWKLGEEVT